MNVAGEGTRNGAVSRQGTNLTLMRRPNQEFPVFIDGEPFVVSANFVPERTTKGRGNGEDEVGFEQSVEVERKVVGLLLHEFTVRSQGLDANAGIGKVGAFEIANNIPKMIGFPQISSSKIVMSRPLADSIPRFSAAGREHARFSRR